MAPSPRAGGSSARAVATRPRRARVDRDRTVEEIEAATADGVAWLRRQVRENPWQTIGTAVGAGFLLGGGLTPRLVGMLLTTTGRLMLADVVSAAFRGATRMNPQTSDGVSADG